MAAAVHQLLFSHDDVAAVLQQLASMFGLAGTGSLLDVVMASTLPGGIVGLVSFL